MSQTYSPKFKKGELLKTYENRKAIVMAVRPLRMRNIKCGDSPIEYSIEMQDTKMILTYPENCLEKL